MIYLKAYLVAQIVILEFYNKNHELAERFLAFHGNKPPPLVITVNIYYLTSTQMLLVVF